MRGLQDQQIPILDFETPWFREVKERLEQMSAKGIPLETQGTTTDFWHIRSI